MSTERLGRSEPRNYVTLDQGYLDVVNASTLNEIEAQVRSLLSEMGATAVPYDEEATAFTEKGRYYHPRTEPVMLHNWKGECLGKVAVHGANNREYDTVGLKVIIRGRGEIQNAVRRLMPLSPDIGSHAHCETYTFGCRLRGVEERR